MPPVLAGAPSSPSKRDRGSNVELGGGNTTVEPSRDSWISELRRRDPSSIKQHDSPDAPRSSSASALSSERRPRGLRGAGP